MLVLTRKQDQEIIVADNIKITVLRIKGSTVRIGIDAPRDVRVMRGELCESSEQAVGQSVAECSSVPLTIDVDVEEADDVEFPLDNMVA